MPGPHFNETVTRSQPREALIAQLGDSVEVEAVTNALEGIGIDTDQIYYLVGQEGATALEKAKTFLSFLDDVISKPLSALRDGHTLVGVFGVDKDNAERVRRCLIDSGATKSHYFGRWTYS